MASQRGTPARERARRRRQPDFVDQRGQGRGNDQRALQRSSFHALAVAVLLSGGTASDMRSWASEDMYSRVRMLSTRSHSLTSSTRMSRAMATSILRKFSASRSPVAVPPVKVVCS